MLRSLALSLVLASPAANGAQEFVVPSGFRVEQAASISEPFIALTFGPDGALLVSVENGGLLRLVDGDGDGTFETVGTFSDELRACQGLAWHDGRVFATGQREGRPGLWRLTPNASGERADGVELLVGVREHGEHGAHGIVPGPDGKLWVAVGNHSALEGGPADGSPLASGYRGNLLPPFDDPLGHAIGRSYPAGFVARVDPDSGSWTYQSVGYRNAYDLAFDAFGEAFTCDSDMEWDVGLPWYRPVRVVRAQPGADFGWRSGSGKWPAWYADSVPAVVDVGRGSPTGVALHQPGSDSAWPARYSGALIVGDWSGGRILAVDLREARVEVLVQARGGLNVTDLEFGPDGALYFASGGRGAAGRIQRLVHAADSSDRAAGGDPSALALAQAQPWSAWGRVRTEELRARAGATWVPGLEAATMDAERPASERVRALWLLEQAAGPVPHSRVAALLADGDADVRAAAAARLAGHRDRAWLTLWTRALEDPEARVRRAACAAAWEDPAVVWPYRTRLAPRLGDPDRFVRAQARAALERGDMFTRPDGVADGSDGPEAAERARAEWALLAARHPVRGVTLAALQSVSIPLWAAIAGIVQSPRAGLEERLVALRAAAVALERMGPSDVPHSQKALADLGAWMLTAFPAAGLAQDESAWRLAHDTALLLAHLEPEGSVDALLFALEAELDRVLQIHYAYCLCRMRSGWTVERRRRLFAWFEGTSEWTGGASLPGYLAAMRDAFIDSVPVEECLAMARGGEASALTLALLVGRLEPERAVELLEPLRAAWAAVPSEARGTPAHAAKSRVLRALVGVRVPGLPELLRGLFEIDGRDHEALWVALARLQDERDWPLFLRGLATPSGEVREACADALVALARAGRAPSEPPIWRGVLDTGARFGWPRGNVHLGVLAAWRSARASSGNGATAEPLAGPLSGPSGGAQKQPEWAGVLAEWEAWFRGEFPDWAPAHASAPPRPSWSAEDLVGFLTRSAGRSGSPALGAGVFRRATCATCHAMGERPTGAPLTGWGPDLLDVTRRFGTLELVDAIVRPSLFVSDQHRVHVVTTVDDERVTGRLVADDAAGITLLADDGQSLHVPRERVASLVPSALSAMPEGLLAPLTLEEVKDLIAYLAVESSEVLDPAVAEWTPLVGRGAAARVEVRPPLWTAADGMLVGESTGIDASDYAWSTAEYGDFEAEFDVLATPGGNSGLQYRSQPGDGPDPVGYQADVGQRYWGSLYASDGRGTLADADARLADVLEPGGWNHFFVRAVGDRHTIEVNGLTTVVFRDARHARGRLAFQLHQGPPMTVRFANLRVRDLDPR